MEKQIRKVMNKQLVFLSLGLLGLILVQGLGACVSDQHKIGYVTNSELFEAYKGTEVLQERLGRHRSESQKLLDSLSRFKDSNVLGELREELMQKEEELAYQYTNDIWKQLNKDISDFAQKNQYQVILGANGSGNLMYADSSLNITHLLIEYSNSRYEGK